MQFKLYYPVIGLRSRVVQLGGAEVSRLKAEVEQLKSQITSQQAPLKGQSPGEMALSQSWRQQTGHYKYYWEKRFKLKHKHLDHAVEVIGKLPQNWTEEDIVQHPHIFHSLFRHRRLQASKEESKRLQSELEDAKLQREAHEQKQGSLLQIHRSEVNGR